MAKEATSDQKLKNNSYSNELARLKNKIFVLDKKVMERSELILENAKIKQLWEATKEELKQMKTKNTLLKAEYKNLGDQQKAIYDQQLATMKLQFETNLSSEKAKFNEKLQVEKIKVEKLELVKKANEEENKNIKKEVAKVDKDLVNLRNMYNDLVNFEAKNKIK